MNVRNSQRILQAHLKVTQANAKTKAFKRTCKANAMKKEIFKMPHHTIKDNEKDSIK